jgi:hypothetical protein
MIRRFLSLATAIGILYVYLQSQLHSDDALFLVASPNFVVNIVLLSLSVIAVGISYKDKFRLWESYLASSVLGAILLFIGFAGVIYSSLDNHFAGLLKPLDYFILLELGIIYGIMSLTYNHPPVELKKLTNNYSLAGLRIRRQLSGLMVRSVIFPGRHTPGSRAA